MRIPKEFQIFAHTFTVVMVDDLFTRESLYGDYDYDLKKIRLQSPCKVRKIIEIDSYEEIKTKEMVEFDISIDMVVETFYHELFHCILDCINEKNSNNERLVSNASSAFLQVLKSGMNKKNLLDDYAR